MFSFRQTDQTRCPWHRVVMMVGLFVAVVIVLRIGSGVASLNPAWDEVPMHTEYRVVQNILAHNWALSSLFDFEDTKGPALFWAYAAWAEIFGDDIHSLRLFSNLLFILSAWPLTILAWRAGIRGWPLIVVGLLYILLPDVAVLGQLFMSEPLFLLGALWLLVVFITGVGDEVDPKRRFLSPFIFCVILSLLLHVRLHAVIYAGAIVLASTVHFGLKRSWPWWIASLIAGLTRVPLWLHWEGLVSPVYQDRYGLGIRFDSLTYTLIALLPCTFVMLCGVVIAMINQARDRRTDPPSELTPDESQGGIASAPFRSVLVGGVIIGLLLGVLAQPDLSRQVGDDGGRFLGMIATSMQPMLHRPTLLSLTITVSAMVGGGFSISIVMPREVLRIA